MSFSFEALNREGTYATKYESAVAKFGTDDLLPLWVADMDVASPPCVIEALQQRAAHPLYGYTDYPKRYYHAIEGWYAKRYAWQIAHEWIVPGYGVVPSINFAIEALTQEGDGVIVQTPIYPPFITSVRHRKRKVLENRLLYQNGAYAIDFEAFEALAKEATLFLLCSPHNPVGRAWQVWELERLAAICAKHQVVIIADEIHGDIVYGRQHRSMGSIEAAHNRCVILNAPSKTFNVAGLNTSYAVIPDKRLRRAYMVEQKRIGITNPNPFGIEALMTAYEEAEGWLEALKEHLAGNIAYVATFLKTHSLPIVPVKTEATFLVWLDCTAMQLSQEALVAFFVEKAKLGLNDGVSFGEGGRGFMRLNVGTSRAVLEQAMLQFLEAWRGVR